MISLPPTVLWIGCFGCPLDPAGLQFPSQDMQNKITHLTPPPSPGVYQEIEVGELEGFSVRMHRPSLETAADLV